MRHKEVAVINGFNPSQTGRIHVTTLSIGGIA
jgi:hypothetical protein